LYALMSSTAPSPEFGFLDQTNPAAVVDRPTVAYGCSFNGAGPYHVVRPLVFTLRPVKVTNEKPGTPFLPSAAKIAQLARAVH
jgi:hypothetical protein